MPLLLASLPFLHSREPWAAAAVPLLAEGAVLACSLPIPALSGLLQSAGQEILSVAILGAAVRPKQLAGSSACHGRPLAPTRASRAVVAEASAWPRRAARA